MPIGAGLAPAGTSPAGYGVISTAQAAPAQILIDANDGVAKEARKIDPRTRQYVFDSQGRIQGMRGIYQLVQLRVETVKDSCTMPGLGQTLGTIAVITPNIQKRILDILSDAVNDLVAQKLIAVVGLELDTFTPAGESRPHGMFARFKWRDITTNDPNAPTNESLLTL